MQIYLLFLRHISSQSKFRTWVTVIVIALATIILSAVISLGQGWMLRSQKVDIVSTLTTNREHDPSAANDITHAVYLSSGYTEFNSMRINEIGIRKLGKYDTLPVGLTDVPPKNEIWVTPALKHLIDVNPLLRERYSLYIVKDSLSEKLASSPDSLMLLYQAQAKTMHSEASSRWLFSASELWDAYSKHQSRDGTTRVMTRTVFLLIGVLLIIPLILLVVEVSKVGILQRKKRYAALSLVGATRSQLQVLVALEALPPSLLGAVLGMAAFEYIGVPSLSRIPIGDSTVWVDDLSLSSGVLVMITGVIVLCSVIANMYAAYSSRLSPLLITRTSNDIKKPFILSILPLLLGVSGFYILMKYNTSWYSANMELGGVVLAILLLIVILGIFIAGPYIVYTSSSLFVKYTRKASTVLAFFRLRAVSRSIFYSISGITLALFVGAIVMTFLATMQAADGQQPVSNNLNLSKNPLQLPLQVTVALPSEPDALTRVLASDLRLLDMTSRTYVQKGFIENVESDDKTRVPIQGAYYASCGQLQQYTQAVCEMDDVGPFVANVEFARDHFDAMSLHPQLTSVDGVDGVTFNKSYVFIARNQASFNDMVALIYTIVGSYQRLTGIPVSVDYERTDKANLATTIQNLNELVMIMLIIVIIIGGLSISINVVGGMFERKRIFVRLRIMGADTATLMTSLLIEIIVPLATLLIIAVCLGIFSCYCLLSINGAISGGQVDFRIPGVDFWVGLLLTIVICVALFIVSTPLLSRLTESDDLRAE